ncbi:dihydrodipicolinate synthase [Colletotrichum salicis]|uniref:Dihydrodipicolinate synthase n=1 Tax=Colletotrichum salicis TaxID=1209931 RepID=A0A135UM29_9PEZI|nr:dihydrodipicolinate synthase [Colletotrichum salicis]
MPADNRDKSPQAGPSYGAPKATYPRLPGGIYAPTLAFFTESEDVDTRTLETHLTRIIKAGVAGIVIHSSIAEAEHLTREEQNTMIRCAADTIHRECHTDFSSHNPPLIAAYHASSYASSLDDDETIIQHFYDFADKSPIPLVIQNPPMVAAGLKPTALTADALRRIAKHPNAVGVTLEDDNLPYTRTIARAAYDLPQGFFVAGSSARYVLQRQVFEAKADGSNGSIVELANLAPYTCVRVRELSCRREFGEAAPLEEDIATADLFGFVKGIVGMKAAIRYWRGYGGVPRKPYAELSPKELEGVEDWIGGLNQAERELEAEVDEMGLTG